MKCHTKINILYAGWFILFGIPIVHEIENPENSLTRVLAFVVLASPDAHSYRDNEKSCYYVRISRETREARNGILTQLLIKKQKIEYFDKRVCLTATETDIDVLLFRESMQEMGLLDPNKSLEDYFSDKDQIAELVAPLFVRTSLDRILRPRNFTLLMFGKKASITACYYPASASIYEGRHRAPRSISARCQSRPYRAL